MYTPDMTQVSAFDAKTHLSQILAKVQQGKHITITKHNVPVAILIPVTPSKKPVDDVIRDLLHVRKGNTLEKLSIEELRTEGRR